MVMMGTPIPNMSMSCRSPGCSCGSLSGYIASLWAGKKAGGLLVDLLFGDTTEIRVDKGFKKKLCSSRQGSLYIQIFFEKVF